MCRSVAFHKHFWDPRGRFIELGTFQDFGETWLELGRFVCRRGRESAGVIQQNAAVGGPVRIQRPAKWHHAAAGSVRVQ